MFIVIRIKLFQIGVPEMLTRKKSIINYKERSRLNIVLLSTKLATLELTAKERNNSKNNLFCVLAAIFFLFMTKTTLITFDYFNI